MNIFETQVTVEKPEGVSDQIAQVYIPIATEKVAGISLYDIHSNDSNPNGDFLLANGFVKLYKIDTLDNSKSLVTSVAVKSYVDNSIANIQISIKDLQTAVSANRADILDLQGSVNNLETSKADKSYVDNNFVTLNTTQTITGEKKFNVLNSTDYSQFGINGLTVSSKGISGRYTKYTGSGVSIFNEHNDYAHLETGGLLLKRGSYPSFMYGPGFVVWDLNNIPLIFPKITKQDTLALNSDVVALSGKIDSLQGKGGYLLPYNFGTSTPTEEQLNNYALSQITNIDNPHDIFNGTKITNLYDNHTWILTNTPDTDPAVFEWTDKGFEFISVATNSALGVVKGSLNDYSVSVDINGEMTVNKLVDLASTVETNSSNISTLLSDVNTLQSDVSTLQTNVNGALSDISNLQSDVTNLLSDISTLQSTVNTNSSNISTLQSTVSTNSSNISTLQSAVNTLRTDVDDIETNYPTTTEVRNMINAYSQALVFNTYNDMVAWLSNPENAGAKNIGDNLLIKATSVPDYWITAVLTQPDPITGYYYEIAELEVQPVDLSNVALKTITNTYTLYASGWTDNAYTLSPTGKTVDNNAEVHSWQGSSVSDAQSVMANTEAIQNANIYQIIDNGTSLTLICETTPTTDVKITVEVFD